jgi:hypothetical protein
MNRFKENIYNSFKLVKNDILKIQSQIIEVNKSQEKFLKILDQLRENELQLYKKIEELNQKISQTKPTTIIKEKEVVKKQTKKVTNFVASKTGKKYHVENCPFALNIKPKSKILFKSKTTALNEGYKPCNCVKH